MHPYEKAIKFLLSEHLRRGDSHSVAKAEECLADIAKFESEHANLRKPMSGDEQSEPL